MGFPRILSKNNKIYTKLGDFCLSGDGTNFWIVCHTCQEELQTQDHFWKHIQDEHNFLHAINKEFKTSTGTYLETAEASPTLMPLPLYRKLNVEEQQREEQMDDEDSEEQQEPKDYTEMRAMETGQMQMDIKVEPHTISQPLPPPQQQQQQVTVNATAAGAGVAGGGNISGSGAVVAGTAAAVGHATTTTLYQIPNTAAYASIVQAPAMPPNTITTNLTQQVAMATLMPQEPPKDSNSTTASASSAVSSEDGERWYVCDHETCGLKFKYQSRLELHRYVHSKERRFACELCGASFKQSCNLSTHRKKKHFLKGSKTLVQQTF